MDDDPAFGNRGAAIGVYVERPNRPGKVFKLRDLRASKDTGGYASQENYPRSSPERDPSPLPSPLPSPSYRTKGLETPDSRGRSGSPLRKAADYNFLEEPRSHRRVHPEHSFDDDDLLPRHSFNSQHSSHDSLRWTVDARPMSRGREDRGPQPYLRQPSGERYSMSAPNELSMSRRPPGPAGPHSSEEFRSWLASVLEGERDALYEVLRGRHIEILSQVGVKLDRMGKPGAPSDSPKPLRVAPQRGMEPQLLPGALVVREDWTSGTKKPDNVPSAKKVADASLTDDTDTKPAVGGDEHPERSIAFSKNPVETIETETGSDSDEDSEEGKKKGGGMSAASSRMITHTAIPHLRKNEFMNELQALPFWHPGRYVHTTQFDAIFCGVILANTVVMALQMQYNGLRRGYVLGAPHFDVDASEYWPQAPLAFLILDWVFGVTYCLELIIKLIGFKRRFFLEWWNWFDGAIVMMWLVEVGLKSVITMEPAVLRMMKMARLLRLIRLVKTIQGFDALYIMTTAMQGSATCLFWSFMLLTTVQMMIAFFLNESLEIYFLDETKPASEKLEVFEYFGTTARVMLTMFELTLANWPTAARILQENVTEFYSLFSVSYKLIVGFAAVGIINGVFMQETFKVAASDDKLMMRQKERDRSLHTKKMRTLFAAADESGDGFIDRQEFCEIMNIPEVRTWLAAQELPVRDPNVLFSLLDDGDAELTAEELVKGVERLKGTAKGIDLAAFIAEYRSFATKVAEKMDITLDFPLPKADDDDDDDDEGEEEDKEEKKEEKKAE